MTTFIIIALLFGIFWAVISSDVRRTLMAVFATVVILIVALVTANADHPMIAWLIVLVPFITAVYYELRSVVAPRAGAWIETYPEW